MYICIYIYICIYVYIYIYICIHCKFQGVKIAPKYGVTCLSNERPDFFGRFLPLSNGVIFTPLLRSNFYPI